MKRVIIGLATAACLAGIACAQGPGGWVITVIYGPGQTSINPGNPLCRVRISATHHPGDFAVHGVHFDLVAAEVGWADPQPSDNLAPMNIAASPGINSGANRERIIGGQLHWPSLNIRADPSTPIAVWEAVWSTNSFRSRQVLISTATTAFDVYESHTHVHWISRLAGLAEGSGNIVVTPAPCGVALFALTGVAVASRRRTANMEPL